MRDEQRNLIKFKHPHKSQDSQPKNNNNKLRMRDEI